MEVSNRGKTYKMAIGFMILCFIMSTLPLPLSSQEKKFIFTDNLVPESVNAEESTERSDKVIIGAVLLGLIKSDASAVSKKVNYFANRKGTTIGVYSEGSFSVPVDTEGESSLVFFTPCFIASESGEKNDIYYAGLTVGGKETNVTVFSEEEFQSQVGKIGSRLKLPEGLIEKFIVEAEAEFQERDSFYVLHISDGAVELAMKFLDQIRSSALREKIKTMAQNNQLKVVAEPAYSPDSIIINSERNQVRERARAILSQLFIVEGFNASDVSGALKAFDLFWENSDEFDIDEIDAEILDPRIKDIFITLNHKLSTQAGNEAGIVFAKKAYTDYIDVSNVDLDDCGEVIEDIGNTASKLFLDEINEHNEKIGVVPVNTRDLKVDIEFMGMSPEDGFVAVDGTISTVKAEVDPKTSRVKIVLNDNFVKVMYLLIQNGLKTGKGDINDLIILQKFMGSDNRYKNPFMGNLYRSILYSAFLHERGHIYINDIGRVMFQGDERLARGKRGRKFLYVNLLATMYFWIGIIEGVGDHRISTRLKHFMKEYPEIFEGLTREERKKMGNHLEELNLDFGIRRGAWLNDLPRGERSLPQGAPDPEEILLIDTQELTTPGEAYSELAKMSDFVSREGLKEALDGIKESRLDWCLSVLVDDLALVERKMVNGDVKYKTVPVDPGQARTVDSIFAENEAVNNGVIDIDLKGNIREAIDTKWPVFLADLLSENIKPTKGAKTPTRKLLYIDTGWLPDSQKPFMMKLIQSMDHLEKFGIIVERGEGDEGAEKLKKRMEKEDIQERDVVVVGDTRIRRLKNLKPILAEKEIDIDKAFFFGIDTKNISNESYIRFMEILSVAMQIALDDRIILKIENFQALHPNIGITVENRRTLVLEPSMERLNLDDIKRIYDAQLDVLLSV